MTDVRHFLDLDRMDAAALCGMLDQARKIKADPASYKRLTDKTLILIFEKPSTRTRVSFETGMYELGGNVTTMTGGEMQLGRGETISDTARVLSRYAHAVMIRTSQPENIEEMAAAATIPVINGLTNATHPCQVMADILTFEERVGPIKGRTIAWTGDGNNNVLASWIHASAVFGFTLRIASPDELAPPARLVSAMQSRGGRITVMDSAREAVSGADAVITDTWVSMHDTNAAHRHFLLESYRVTKELMALAQPKAIFMHCLPAHRGEEVTNDVMDGPQSAVWDEAENRKHAQKAILLWCMGRDVG